MIGQNTFRFHKFTEEEKKPDRYGNTYSKGFFSSNLLSTRQKSRTFQNRQSSSQDYTSKNFNSKSYQFKNSNNIFSLTSRKFNRNNFMYSDNNTSLSSNFPLDKIINTDFDFILKKGDTTTIDKFLPQMIYNDLSFSNNNHLQLILKKFQNVLEFLFTEQNKLLNNNSQIEELFNNQNSNLNKKLRQLEQDEYKINNLLNANHAQISKLIKKIKTYKSILISTGNENLIPNITLMKIENKGGYYQCKICPDKIFKTYEEIHTHYIMGHFKSFDNKNMIYNSNNLNKKYFENQLNIFKTQLKNELLYINKEYDDTTNNKKFIDLKQDKNLSDVNLSNKLLNSQTLRNKIHSSNNLRDYRKISTVPNNGIYTHLNRLEFEQEQQFKRMTENLNKLKIEIFNQIQKLGTNQPIIVESTNENIINSTIKQNSDAPNDNNQINIEKENNSTNMNDVVNQNINNNGEKNNNKGKEYITPSQKIDEESKENEPSYTPGAGLNNSSIKYSINKNPYNIDDQNNNKSQIGENINDNNNKQKKSQFEESINNNNNNYFKTSIMQNDIENEMKNSFINKIKHVDPNIIKLSTDYNYIFEPNKNKEKTKDIIKESEKKYCKNKKDYKEIIYNIIKDNKNKYENDPKFMEYYNKVNKVIENYNIPELKAIELEYKQKEEEIQMSEEEEKERESNKEKIFESNKGKLYESNPAVDYEGFLNQKLMKSSNKKSFVKKEKDSYDSVVKLLDKEKRISLEEDL